MSWKGPLKMANGKTVEQQNVYQQIATASELLRLASEYISSAIYRVSDRNVQTECDNAQYMLLSARARISENIIPQKYLESALARIMITQLKNWRNLFEESIQKNIDAKNQSDREVTISDFFPSDFIDKFSDLARDAELIEIQIKKENISGNGVTVK